MTSLEALLALFSDAQVIDLEQRRTIGMPGFPTHWPGYNFALHRRHEPGLERRTSAMGFIYQGEHAGTHIDAFCHQAEDMAMLGGIKATADVQTPTGFTELGVEMIDPIIRRGVLLDLAKLEGGPLAPRRLISDADLERTAEAQGTAVRQGDVLLIRVGWGPQWSDPATYIDAPGMDRTAAEWAADHGVFAVGADNMSWDLPGYTDEVTGSTLPAHSVLLVRTGIHIVENMLLEDLSGTGAHEFLFVCIPLKYVGGTGCPVRPLAIVAAQDR